MKQQPENQCSLQTKRHLYPIQEFHFTQEGCFGDELPNHASSAIQNNVENMSSCSSFISHHDLRNILINISECVHPQVEKRFSWIYKAQSNALLFSILGDHSHYNIAQSLHVLRSACENNKRENVHSSGVNLLRRAFAVHVLNSQNSSPQPCQNSRVDTTATLQLYQDLCFSDINILPQARKSNAVNFYSFCLYQSERKRIRLHYIYPTTTTTNTTTTKSDSSNTTSQEDERTIPSHPHHVQQDQFPHDHYGNASSIILCGSLVNQFFQVKRVETIHSNTNCSAEYAMYKLCRGGKQELSKCSNVTEQINQKSTSFSRKLFTYMFDIRLELISSHCYHSGQQYFLPMVRESSEPQKIQDDDNEPLIFHQIGTNQPTVTLFCMDIPESWTSWYSYTTFHLNTPKYIEKDSKDNQVLSENEANHLVQMLDTSIVNSLSELGL